MVRLPDENDPVADAYCTDHPFTDTAEEVGLKISMKSLLQVAPLFPPPPYTWLMTREAEAGAEAGGGAGTRADARSGENTAHAASPAARATPRRRSGPSPAKRARINI